MGFDGRELRDALGRFATGVCVVTTVTADGRALGMTANSFSSVSLDPPLVLWCLQNNSEVYESFAHPPHFAISVLAEAQVDLSQLYARKGEHLLSAGHYDIGRTGSPVMRDALASFECTLEATHEAGDHLIIVGRVRQMSADSSGNPLLFFAGGYRALR